GRQLRPVAREQGGCHRGVPSMSRIGGRLDRPLVGRATSCGACRSLPAARLVEERRRRRVRLVGRSSRRGSAPALTELRTAYDGSGAAWARGPSRLFDLLANRVIERFAAHLRGATVLDVGAGTGAVSRTLQRAGASPVAVDASADMLAHVGDSALLTVVGDICSLPFLDDTFDAAVSAFVISHVDDPVRALAEMRRVVRAPGLIVAAVFGAASANASKDVIHDLAVQYGFEPPAWYRHLKAQTEPLSNTPDLLRGCAHSASLEAVVVDDIDVDSE